MQVCVVMLTTGIIQMRQMRLICRIMRVAVVCSVLCVAVCYSVSQCVAVWDRYDSSVSSCRWDWWCIWTEARLAGPGEHGADPFYYTMKLFRKQKAHVWLHKVAPFGKLWWIWKEPARTGGGGVTAALRQAIGGKGETKSLDCFFKKKHKALRRMLAQVLYMYICMYIYIYKHIYMYIYTCVNTVTVITHRHSVCPSSVSSQMNLICFPFCRGWRTPN